MTDKTYDVIIVGGGVVGLSIANQLALDGLSVLVLDAAQPGMGASWAGSGALALIMPDVAPPALRPLAARSQAMWPAFANALEERVGFSIELRNSGLLRLLVGDEAPAGVRRTVSWQREHDVRVDALDSASVRAMAPILNEDIHTAFHEPRLMQVRTPRLTRALKISAQLAGAEVAANEPVVGFVMGGGRVAGVCTVLRQIQADQVVLAAGAHAGALSRRALGLNLPLRPVRGQLVLLEGPAIGHCPLLLGSGGQYLIPRADGRILAGSTFENAGFDRSVTAEGVSTILNGALGLAPALGQARVVGSWAGLRPESPDRLPYLGCVPGLLGLVVAAGHFRDGILLTPVTARVISDIVHDRASDVDISAFAPDREIAGWVV